MFKLLLPTQLTGRPRIDGGVEVVEYDSSRPVPAEHIDADGIVVWGNPATQLADCARRMSRVRWIQTVAAGADPVFKAGFSQDVIVTNGAGLHNTSVAEHALALILAATRRLDLCVLSQQDRVWRDDLRAMSPSFSHDGLHTLRDARVTIWGLGEIGLTLAVLLQALGSSVIGIGRTKEHRAGFEVVAREDAERQLAQTDVLVMLLPATSSTEKALDERHVRALRRHAWVVNLGRGSTVDEVALAGAVRERRIAGCALDVFEEEPLPSSSPWWDLSNVIISPHSAGGRPVGHEPLIQQNLNALLAGETMRNVVQRDD